MLILGRADPSCRPAAQPTRWTVPWRGRDLPGGARSFLPLVYNYMKSQGYEPTAGRVLTTPPRGPQRGAEVSSPDRGSGRGGGSPKTSQLRLVLGADGPHPAKLPLSFVALLTFTLALFCTLVLSRGRFGILLCNGSVFELLTLTLSPAPVTMRL